MSGYIRDFKQKLAVLGLLITAIILLAGLPQSPHSIISNLKKKSGQTSFDLPVGALSSKLAISQCSDESLKSLYNNSDSFEAAKSGLGVFKARLSKEHSKDVNSLALSVPTEPQTSESKTCLVPFKISADSKLSKDIDSANLMEVALGNKALFCSRGKSYIFADNGFFSIADSLASYSSYIKGKKVIAGLNKKIATLKLRRLSANKTSIQDKLGIDIRKLKLALAYARYFVSEDSALLSEFFDSVCTNAAIAATPQALQPTAIVPTSILTFAPSSTPLATVIPTVTKTNTRTPTRPAVSTPHGSTRISPPAILSPGNNNDSLDYSYALPAGTSQLIVSWSKVTNSSGSARYLIRALDITTNTPLFPNNDSYTSESKTIEGLKNGHSYRFWVHAAKDNFSYSEQNSYSEPVYFYFNLAGSVIPTPIPTATHIVSSTPVVAPTGIFVAPISAGLANGQSSSNPMSFSMAMEHSRSKSEKAERYILLPGDYGHYADNLIRTARHVLVSHTRHSAKFKSMRLDGSMLTLDGFSIVNQDMIDIAAIVAGHDIIIDNFKIDALTRHKKGANAMSLGGFSNILQNSELMNSGRVLKVTGTSAKILNNAFHGSSSSLVQSAGANDQLFEGNKMYDADHRVAEDAYCVLGTGPKIDWSCSYSEATPHENLFIARHPQKGLVLRGNFFYRGHVNRVTIRDGENSSAPITSNQPILIENNIIAGELWAMTGNIILRNNFINSTNFGACEGVSGGPSILSQITGNIIGGYSIKRSCSKSSGTAIPDKSKLLQAYNIFGNATYLGQLTATDINLKSKWDTAAATVGEMVAKFGGGDFSDYHLKPQVKAIDFVREYATPTDLFGNTRIRIADAGPIEYR